MINRRGSDRFHLVPALTTLLVAFVIVAGAVGVKVLIDNVYGTNIGFIIYVPAVALAAWIRGFLGGIMATVLGALLDSLVFVPPLLVVAVDLTDYRLRMVAYIAGGVAVSYLAYRLRRERDHARRESSERRRALEETAAAQAELARLVATERRASEMRDAFNGIISHELRTPITAIYGGAKLLARRDRELDPGTRHELIVDLEAEADRLYRLVEDLLVLSRSERGSIDRVDDPVVVQRIVDRVINSERGRWPSITFEHETRAASPARGDETYVEQVLRNLLSNAAKYSPAGTTVTAITDETTEGVRVRVLDRGAGIDVDESNRLFELYYRSPATAGLIGGAGIGLFVCRALVQAMGGRIWATPREGGGSEFGFVLERQPDEELVEDLPAKPQATAARTA